MPGTAWTPRLHIEQAGSEVLHRPASPVRPAEVRSDDIQRLIDAMFATLAGVGVGLAAPQVGVGLQVVVIEDPPEFLATQSTELLLQQERIAIPAHVLINPTLSLDETEVAEFFEGCLSVDGYRAIVPRARRVRVHALDRSGEPFEREAVGWYARIVQHEVDHLAGRLYVERMRPRTLVSASSYAQYWSKVPILEARQRLA